MNYVTTNIRIAEEDYLKLKSEAAKSRKSLAAIIRERIKGVGKERSQSKTRILLEKLEKVAIENSRDLKGWNSLNALREIRGSS